jgi:pyruvate/2-oxoglutarate dehydrogenase complex dihydrolipoamide acyltransferase (E2) component
LDTFRGKNITRDSFAPIEQRFGSLPKFLEKELVSRPWTHPSKLDESLARQEMQIDRSLQQYKMLAADPQNTPQQKTAWQERIAAKEQELKDLQAADNWLQPIIKTGKSFENLGLDTRAYSYRGTIAEDPARTVLFDKPLSEQLPEVQAALARANSRVRKDLGGAPTQAVGTYITEAMKRAPEAKHHANPKMVQRLRDAGIDLIKYGGSSESPNYVVVNPAAAKIQSRTPSIAATFGTGELARQLYESIYGKDAQ